MEGGKMGADLSFGRAGRRAIADALSRSAAPDWVRFGIRVNCIAHGSTETAMLATVIDDLSARHIGTGSLAAGAMPIDGGNWHCLEGSTEPPITQSK